MEQDISKDVLTALRRIIRAIDVQSRHLTKYYGLTGPQLVVLEELQDNWSMTIGQLARNISLSQATVTNIIDRLEQKGDVKRIRSERDKRKVFVEMTPQAEQKLADKPSLLQKQFIDRFNQLEDWEQTLILSSLQRIVSMMNAEDIEVQPMLYSGEYNQEN